MFFWLVLLLNSIVFIDQIYSDTPAGYILEVQSVDLLQQIELHLAEQGWEAAKSLLDQLDPGLLDHPLYRGACGGMWARYWHGVGEWQRALELLQRLPLSCLSRREKSLRIALEMALQGCSAPVLEIHRDPE